MLTACRQWLAHLVSLPCRRKRAAPPMARAAKSQRVVGNSEQALADDELSSLLVSEPQRQGWLALPSQHRPRNEAVKAAIKEAVSTDTDGHFDIALVDIIADYLYFNLQSTFVPQLQPLSLAASQQDTSLLLGSKWAGMPLLFADEPWPRCEEGHPLDFHFQLRQCDYPLVLQQSTWVQPSDPASDEDAGQLLFQFFCCSVCQPSYSNSLIGDTHTHGLQHCIAATGTEELEEDGSRVDEQQPSRLAHATTHPSNAVHSCLMRVIDPRLGASRTAADAASFPPVVQRHLLRPRHSECSLGGWREVMDYPSTQQDVDDIVSACPADRRLALLARLEEYVEHFETNDMLHVDRMGGWAWWDDDTRYSSCPIGGCDRRLHFFYQVWNRHPDEGHGCVGVITQCRVHRHFFHFSWGCGFMN